MHVVVNAAMSVDGKLSSRRREQITISGPEDFDRVDHLRAAADAVMVGVGTVVADDPALEIEAADGGGSSEARQDSPQPARVVADSTARTPPSATVLEGAARTYILVAGRAPGERVEQLRAAGAEVIEAGDARVALPMALAELESRGITELLVEGGGELLFSLFDEGLVDDLSVYVGSTLIGGREAPTLIDGPGWVSDFPALTLTDVIRMDDGVLLTYDVG